MPASTAIIHAHWSAQDAHNAAPTPATLDRVRTTAAALVLSSEGDEMAATILLDGGPIHHPDTWTGSETTAAATRYNLLVRPYNPEQAARNGLAHHWIEEARA